MIVNNDDNDDDDGCKKLLVDNVRENEGDGDQP